MTLYERFAQFEDDYLEFDKVQSKRSTRPDLHAFMLLDSIFPDTKNIIASSGHDEFHLSISFESFHGLVTDAQIKELVQCGIRVSEYECLSMFV